MKASRRRAACSSIGKSSVRHGTSRRCRRPALDGRERRARAERYHGRLDKGEPMTHLIALRITCMALASLAANAFAADLHVIAGGVIAAPLKELAVKFEQSTGHKV